MHSIRRRFADLVAHVLEAGELALLLGGQERAVADLAHVGAEHVDGGASPLLLVVLGLGVGLVEQLERALGGLLDDLVLLAHETQVRSGDDGLFFNELMCGNGHVSVFSCPGNDGAPYGAFGPLIGWSRPKLEDFPLTGCADATKEGTTTRRKRAR